MLQIVILVAVGEVGTRTLTRIIFIYVYIYIYTYYNTHHGLLYSQFFFSIIHATPMTPTPHNHTILPKHLPSTFHCLSQLLGCVVVCYDKCKCEIIFFFSFTLLLSLRFSFSLILQEFMGVCVCVAFYMVLLSLVDVLEKSYIQIWCGIVYVFRFILGICRVGGKELVGAAIRTLRHKLRFLTTSPCAYILVNCYYLHRFHLTNPTDILIGSLHK